jgi:CheY-like chemotaxis protein
MSKHVLVIDDDPGLQETLQATLESEGYEVTIAADGLDALEKLQSLTPAVIVLDLMMPRMDGYAFAHELEARGLRPSIPIMILTADSRARQKVQSVKPDAFLAKPFEITELLDEVARLAG